MKHHSAIGATTTARQHILRLAQSKGIIRARDLAAHGYSRETLRRLVSEGRLIARSRGIYFPADASPGERETLSTVALRVPHGVICLLSALRFHELTSQNPTEIWLAIDHKAWAPKTDLPLRIVRFSGLALRAGIDTHLVDNVNVRVYNVAKTIADCFKFRRKIGNDIAIEALRDCWSKRLCTIDNLWKYAKVCRVTNVIRPYLEALTS